MLTPVWSGRFIEFNRVDGLRYEDWLGQAGEVG